MGYMDGDILGNEDNLEVANPLSTPEHIVPEVYFDFLFYVLRCISIKYVGVYGVGGWVCCMISFFYGWIIRYFYCIIVYIMIEII